MSDLTYLTSDYFDSNTTAWVQLGNPFLVLGIRDFLKFALIFTEKCIHTENEL